MLQVLNIVVALSLTQHGMPAGQAAGNYYVPKSNIARPGDAGKRAHTNVVVRLFGSPGPAGAPPGLSPAFLKSVYNLPSSGGSGIIALVDAYHYPTSLNDFNFFSNYYGLPTEPSTNPTASTNKVFQVVYASGAQPPTDTGWALEACLDIEVSHGMAPNAKIILVEAASNSSTDLFNAVTLASQLVTANGGKGEVSMSWGSSEFPGEGQSFDSYFQTPGVVYVASTGDYGGLTEYPSVSPFVVAAGGTTINLNPDGSFNSETGWDGGGGGLSTYEPRPSYQNGIQSIVGPQKGVPDMSFDADPNSGASIYDTTRDGAAYGWIEEGGTSEASPGLAGIINLAGSFYPSSQAELHYIYRGLGSSNFRDIVSGVSGAFSCTTGWDMVTGVGTPLGLTNK